MRSYDLSPLYRSLVGIDRVSDLLNAAARADSGNGYPPYNIEEIGENAYRIELAVAGFSEADLELEVNDATLVVSGKKSDETERAYLHHGIGLRAFERRFQLADYVQVRGAKLENGLLSIDLEREIPERLKPRKIEISGGRSKPRVIETETVDAA